MTPSLEAQLDELVEQVRVSGKYAAIDPELIRRLGAAELSKRASLKEAEKATRNKLHQVGSAYQEKTIPYATLQTELSSLPADLSAPDVTTYLHRCLQFHASTRERLPIYETLFKETLAELGPLHSVLDLACGFNPLALAQLPRAADFTYCACDIYTDMITFLTNFFAHFGIKGTAFICDLSHDIPQQPAQLALLLKTIPCLEQIDKSAGQHLLEDLQTPNILVTFPAHSLGGRSKGMVANYSAHFDQLVAGKPWHITRYDFPGELAFLIRK